MTYISNINAIFEDMFGEYLMIRDYDTLYTRDNVACFEDSCYHFGEGVDDVIASQNIIATGEENVQIGEKVLELEPETSVYDPDLKDQKIIDRMQGNILLQVEQHGEAWYLHPELDKRYYMKDGPTAYEMMRQFGLGIADADLMKIPAEATPADMLEATSICKTNSLARRLSGRILLQVEQHGEAWYIQPDTCRRIYMKDGESAYNIMRFLSKGIADSNLKAIPSDVLNSNFGQ
ncbi:hypothetical protein COV92_01840 [Candidatus Uhrbacteria bacterium CG11_big_fil_rev_8_21_14_0_20_41_9]|nr:MAG: hypothetical protein COV92_01840 [Candidatus Uhrbacteria bacterium CG11_big_fil_rev_8_21_14_0_20_41_9]